MDQETREFLEGFVKAVNGRFDSVDARFDAMEKRFDSVERAAREAGDRALEERFRRPARARR